MPCHTNAAGTVHVCRPTGYRFEHGGTCPDCGKRTWFIGVFYVWYGPDKVCLRCGRQWSDGYWMPLDFIPQSRQKSIERMKEAYRQALRASPYLPAH